MRQRTIFDADAGAMAREDAIARVDEHNGDWVDAAEVAAHRLLPSLGRFTTDELWHALPDRPREPRAMGALMRRLASRNLAVLTGEWRLSKIPACHRRPKAVWRAVVPF